MRLDGLFKLIGCLTFFVLLGFLFFSLLPVLLPLFLIVLLFVLFNPVFVIHSARRKPQPKRDDDVIDVEVIHAESEDENSDSKEIK